MASVESAISTSADIIAAKKLVAKTGSRSSASRSRSRGASTSASEVSGISNVSSVASATEEVEPVERFSLWGCELAQNIGTRCNDTHVLKFPEDADEDNEVHRLSLKSATLGLNAREKERNVVELHFVDTAGEEQRIAIASLTLGTLDTCKLDLAMTWARGQDMTLKLVRGTGPVAIVGNHVIEVYDEAEDDAYVPTDDESSATESGMDTEGDDVEDTEVTDIVKDAVKETVKETGTTKSPARRTSSRK